MTLYTLDTSYFIKKNKLYLIATILTVTFSAIYEYFSHGVYSKYMIFAFIFPLIGFILSTTYKHNLIKKFPNKIVTNIFDASLATLTAGGILQGFLEIYGTTNSLIIIYPVVGLSLLLISIIIYFNQDNR